jgi:RHS repeat-associated protein
MGGQRTAASPAAMQSTMAAGYAPSLDAVSVKVDYTAQVPTTITVNAVGATTARGADTFTYDQANRLTTATVAGATETYAYDGDGVRVSRQVGADPVIGYVSDVNSNLPVTLDDGTHKYVYGLGLAYAVSGSAIEVYHADRLGSIRAITDAAGTVTATFQADEFGVPTASTGTSTQPFGYTGEPRDGTGLSYLRARYYDPSLGRFMSRDPWSGSVGAPQTLDRYVYVGNNPTTANDPSGLASPGGRWGPGAGSKTKSKVLVIDLLPCDPDSFFVGLGLLVGGSLRAAVGLVALVPSGGASSLPSWIAITTGSAAAATGGKFIWAGYNCQPELP